MDQVADLKNQFLTSGGSEAAFEEIGRGKLGLVDGQPQDGCLRPRDAREQALRSFVPGALIEIQCYNSRGRSQGEEILVFEKWISKSDLTFRASHLVASNDYYEWWASHEAMFAKSPATDVVFMALVVRMLSTSLDGRWYRHKAFWEAAMRVEKPLSTLRGN